MAHAKTFFALFTFADQLRAVIKVKITTKLQKQVDHMLSTNQKTCGNSRQHTTN